jgi:histidine ammonia-lyase
MGLNSARKSLQLCENVTTILGVLVAACYQASFFVGQEKFNGQARSLHEELARLVPQYDDSTPMNEYLATVRQYVEGEELARYLDAEIELSESAR